MLRGLLNEIESHQQRLATPTQSNLRGESSHSGFLCVLEVSSPKISFMLYSYVQDTARKQEPTYTPNGILPDGGFQRCQVVAKSEIGNSMKKGENEKKNLTSPKNLKLCIRGV